MFDSRQEHRLSLPQSIKDRPNEPPLLWWPEVPSPVWYRPGLEFNHSPSFSAEVEIAWIQRAPAGRGKFVAFCHNLVFVVNSLLNQAIKVLQKQKLISYSHCNFSVRMTYMFSVSKYPCSFLGFAASITIAQFIKSTSPWIHFLCKSITHETGCRFFDVAFRVYFFALRELVHPLTLHAVTVHHLASIPDDCRYTCAFFLFLPSFVLN